MKTRNRLLAAALMTALAHVAKDAAPTETRVVPPKQAPHKRSFAEQRMRDKVRKLERKSRRR